MCPYEVLAIHKAVVEFTGIEHFPCLYMTSLCPDRCTHAHDAGIFKILEYEDYQKAGRYGDGKQTMFRVRLDSRARNNKQDPAFIEMIKGFTPGQRLRISWEHTYVTDPVTMSKWAERPLRSIEKI
jgi:hypothetical protein